MTLSSAERETMTMSPELMEHVENAIIALVAFFAGVGFASLRGKMGRVEKRMDKIEEKVSHDEQIQD